MFVQFVVVGKGIVCINFNLFVPLDVYVWIQLVINNNNNNNNTSNILDFNPIEQLYMDFKICITVYGRGKGLFI